VKILLLTADRETARIYSDAAERAGNLRICVRKNTAQVLERLFRDPFDALLSDDASVVRAGIRSCPVQWPPNIFLLVDRLSGPLRMPQTLTFCFMKDSDPLNVLNCIAGFPKTAQNHTDTETAISRFLQQMGVPVSLNGFDCLRIALRILLTQNNLLDCPINELYTVLSEIMGIGAYVAEHAVRHAIDAAWIRADTALQEQIFGYTVRSDRGAPSNAAFLLRAADHMKMTGEGTME
jgi:hypothetical protein